VSSAAKKFNSLSRKLSLITLNFDASKSFPLYGPFFSTYNFSAGVTPQAKSASLDMILAGLIMPPPGTTLKLIPG